MMCSQDYARAGDLCSLIRPPHQQVSWAAPRCEARPTCSSIQQHPFSVISIKLWQHSGENWGPFSPPGSILTALVTCTTGRQELTPINLPPIGTILTARVPLQRICMPLFIGHHVTWTGPPTCTIKAWDPLWLGWVPGCLICLQRRISSTFPHSIYRFGILREFTIFFPIKSMLASLSPLPCSLNCSFSVLSSLKLNSQISILCVRFCPTYS